MTRLACVIPFFNGASTIARALDSVLHSPVCDEVVLVSDASLEPVRSTLKERHIDWERSGRLRVVEMATNLGQAAARNLGAALATAPLISFLDQDDEVLPDFHVKAKSILDSATSVASVEVGASIFFDGVPLVEESDPRYRLILDSVPWNVIVRRAAFWACGGFPTEAVFRTEAAGEDIAFKSALKACFRVAALPSVGVRHHVRNGSATDRFLRRTSVGANREVVFHSRYPAESDGSLSAALGQHVGRALQNRTALAHLFELSR
jgi:glycosyltransferase involved in cell wall biosynthesis